MGKLFILDEKQEQSFDTPPKLTTLECEQAFYCDNRVKQVLRSLTQAENKVGFLIQLGYFCKTGKFFTTEQFRPADIHYVAQSLKCDAVEMARYKDRTNLNHRHKICHLLGWKKFNATHQRTLMRFIDSQVTQSQLPEAILEATLAYCCQIRLEIPSYFILNQLIAQSYRRVESRWLILLKKQMNMKQKRALDKLLTADSTSASRSQLVALKQMNQAITPTAIQENVSPVLELERYFLLCQPIIDTLNLCEKTVHYYADWVDKATTPQLRALRSPYKRYLHLLRFIKHHYYLRHHQLANLLKRCALNTDNTAKQTADNQDKIKRPTQTTTLLALAEDDKCANQLIEQIETALTSTVMTPTECLDHIQQLIDRFHHVQPDDHQATLEQATQAVNDTKNQQDYFDALETNARKLQNRCRPILLALRFDEYSSNQSLLRAIAHFQTKAGQLTHRVPHDFLTDEEKKAVGHGTSCRLLLYKALLFIHTAKALRQGTLNLNHSYGYRAFKTYLFDDRQWEAERDALITRAGLDAFVDKQMTLDQLEQQLDHCYRSVNQRYQANQNPHITVHPDRHISIRTPKVEKDYVKATSNVLEGAGFTSIASILEDVDRVTQFSRTFRHSSIKHAKLKKLPALIHAGIIAKGCNIGVPRMGRMSAGISEDKLNHLVTWCFDVKNLQSANRALIQTINRLALPLVYCQEPIGHHTSSDGRKVTVDVESLMATYSFKYFGKDKGVTVYTFIDDRQILFHSTVFSANEREATYVIDSLVQNEVVKSALHSTDTHGFSELIFATSHLLGTTFAPRLKNAGKQTLYGFSSPKTYENKGYAIRPKARINRKLIEEHWDDILRFMATIKLHHTSAPDLFKHLNSYTRQHPLYRALKEFGRIIKSYFLLKYMDDVKLHQRIALQLSRIELSNRFSKAIFYANHQAFQTGEQKQMQIATACKVLIQNAIVLWNYLYLSQHLLKQSEKTRMRLLQGIQNSSVMCWEHVNLQGEFDFTRKAANQNFNMREILSLKIA